jgi:predicted dithiol-disulfide oxidoreductase (DUF899 family)
MAKKTRPKKKAISRKKAPRKPARKKARRLPARHAVRPAPKPVRKKAAKPKKKARKAQPLSSVRFPGEDPRYRKARDQLLKAEVELRRLTEAVAAERRKLPRGGELLEDYVFEESNKAGGSRAVKLSELFAPDKHTLVLYNFMYGPAMQRACPSCSTMLDALDANAKAISQRVNLAIVAKSPLPRILSHARDRGWYALRLLSSADNSYNRDYHGESPDGSQMPMLNVFVKRGAAIRHLWGSELLYAPTDKGQDSRHSDFLFPLWSVFDLAPEGRGKDWRPQLSYF